MLLYFDFQFVTCHLQLIVACSYLDKLFMLAATYCLVHWFRSWLLLLLLLLNCFQTISLFKLIKINIHSHPKERKNAWLAKKKVADGNQIWNLGFCRICLSFVCKIICFQRRIVIEFFFFFYKKVSIRKYQKQK